MLQRVQTLFLILALPVSLLIWIEFMVLARLTGDLSPLNPPDGTLMADGVLTGYEHVGLLLAILLPAVLCLFAVFLFRNRPRQLMLTRLAAWIYAFAILLAAVFIYRDYSQLEGGARYLAIGPGMLLPVAGIILCLLAIRFIKKDEKLVRSMDRLR